MSTWIERLAAMENAPEMKPLVVDGGREPYLAWVAHWKENYRWISTAIRAARVAKREHRDAAREGKSPDVHREAMGEAESRAWRLSVVAHHWHMLRLEGKRESWHRRCLALGVPNERDPEMSEELQTA